MAVTVRGRLFRRRGPDPLGEGVWRRAHDRFRRAVDRFHQVIEPVPPGPERDRLELVGASLAGSLDLVHALCVQAQAEAPSSGLDVPRGPDGRAPDLHRRLSRAGTLAAQAAEAAAMCRVALRPVAPDPAGRGAAAANPAAASEPVTAAERAAAAVRSLVAAG